MKIGELAKATGLTTKTIRFYEEERLLPNPGRTPSGYRVYGSNDIMRLEFVRRAKSLGLSLSEVKSVLLIHNRKEPTCAHVRSLFDAQIARIDQALADLQEFRSEIVRLRRDSGDVVDCRPSGGRICGIIEGGEIGGQGRALSWVAARPGTQRRRRGTVPGRAQ